MGYLSVLSIGAFKKKAGRLIYFPWGIFGSGFELQDWERRRTIVFFGRVICATGLFVVVFTALFSGWMACLGAAFASVGAYQLVVGRFTRSMPRSPERLGFLENLRNQATEHSFLSLWVTETICLGIVAVAAWSVAQKGGLPALELFAGLLLLPFTLIFGVMIREKLR